MTFIVLLPLVRLLNMTHMRHYNIHLFFNKQTNKQTYVDSPQLYPQGRVCMIQFTEMINLNIYVFIMIRAAHFQFVK